MIQYLQRATNLLPHRRIQIPHRANPKARFSLYADCELGFAANIYESNVITELRERVNNETVVADVGAHIGIYSVLLALDGATVHAFEPMEENYSRIREHAIQNGVEDQITVHEAAADATTGSTEIAVNDAETNTIMGGGDETRVVDTLTLDSVFNSTLPDLVKVDVEGAGGRVLKGATSLLNEETTWIVECHSPTEERTFEQTFREQGYDLRWVSDNHLLAD